MNGDIDRILVFVGQFNHFLHLASCTWHSDESGEASDAVVDVHHIVSHFELHEFLQCQCHLRVASVVRLQIVFVEAVKDLVVCEAAEVKVLVGESGVECAGHGCEVVGVFRAGEFVEDVLQTFVLFRTVGEDEEAVPFGACFVEMFAEKFKVLVEERLRRSVETHDCLCLCLGICHQLHAAQVGGAPQQGRAL